MKKIVKLIVIGSFFSTAIGCSSDDNNQQPTGPTYTDKYLISQVKSINYWTSEELNEDGTIEIINVLDNRIDFNFDYDQNLILSSLNHKVSFYNPQGEISKMEEGRFDYKLNAANQVITLNITGNPMFANSLIYTYQNDLLTKYSSQRKNTNFEHTFTYNALKQFTSSYIAAHNSKYDYSYNAINQIVQIKNSFYNTPSLLEYDTKNNPFQHLPFDLTTLLFEQIQYIEYLPLTYFFPNNITYYESPNQDIFTVEYSYDEHNNPIKATIYNIADHKKIKNTEIEYTYIAKKVEVVK